MKIAGHTMGTPELTPEQAVDLFASMGFDGVEFVTREGYLCGPTIDWSHAERARLRGYCAEKGLPIVCLTAYMTDVNSEDAAEGMRQLQMLRDTLALAHDLGAPVVRLYGGRSVPPEKWEHSVQVVVERLRSLVGLCKELGVKIAVENHFGTLTTTAAKTMSVVAGVAAPEIGVVYDQANVTYEHGEGYQEAIDLQKDHILHVHAKDLVFLEGATESDVSLVTHLSAEKRIARWVVLGQGVLPWKDILRSLKGIGYDGYVSVEYTYKKAYEGELPPPEIGMKQSLDLLKGLLREV